MQPYQEASGQIKRQGEMHLRTLKTAGGVAASLFGGISLARVLPLLSKYITPDIAIKGLSRIDPRFGKFINKAMGAGKTFEEVKEFIKEKMQPGEKGEETPIQKSEEPIGRQEQQSNQNEPIQPYAGGHKEPFQGQGAANTIDPNQQQEQSNQMQQEQGQQRNIIQQYSPELYQFMAQEIGNGRNPLEAAAIAQNDKRFQGIIGKMQQQTRMKWSDIIAQIFGQQQQKAQGMPQQGQQMQQQAQQGPGQGAQALMQVLQKINQRLGG